MTQTNPSAILSVRPPPAPRELTARVRRRSWVEPRVRTWWLAAAGLLLIAGYFVARELAKSAQDRSLVRNGTRVQAEVVEGSGVGRKDVSFPPDLRAVFKLRYQLPGREPVEIVSQLKDQRTTVVTGKTIPLYVDPADPARWTDRLEISLLNDLLVGIILSPVVLVLLGIGLASRYAVLRTWRTGVSFAAVVVEMRQTASAPLSRLVRFTPGGGDNRVLSTLMPARLGSLNAGDTIWLVAPERQPGRALVAAAYIEPPRP